MNFTYHFAVDLTKLVFEHKQSVHATSTVIIMFLSLHLSE